MGATTCSCGRIKHPNAKECQKCAGDRVSHKGLSEHEIQSQILGYLKAKHVFHFRSNAGAMGGSHKGKRWYVKFGPKGGPDIFAIVDGRIIGIEVKALDGFQSQVQVEFEHEFVHAGGIYILARKLEDVTRRI